MNLSVIEDQIIAGILMWIPGSEMFFWVAILVLTQIVKAESQKTIEPNPAWLVEETTAVQGT